MLKIKIKITVLRFKLLGYCTNGKCIKAFCVKCKKSGTLDVMCEYIINGDLINIFEPGISCPKHNLLH